MKSKFCLFLLVVVTISSCTQNHMEHKPIRLAMSKATDNYINWIHRVDSTVDIVDLQGLPVDSAIELLLTCDGILFTGGEDVHPGFYSQVTDTSRCEMKPDRDTLEFALIRKALKKKYPVLGICRGLQILNVAQGGTLVVDIPTDYPSDINHRCEDYTKCGHPVDVLGETLIHEVCKADTGWVNSNHHQAIAVLGDALRISARSKDGLPEAIEWADPKDKAYFMAVQWHPERMEAGSPLSDPLAKAFLQACIIRRVLK